jgi:hypothetical protein
MLRFKSHMIMNRSTTIAFSPAQWRREKQHARNPTPVAPRARPAPNTPRGATKAHDITKMIQACLVHHVTCAHGNLHIPPSTSTIVHLSSCALLRMHVRVYVAKHPCSERRRNEAAEELHGASAQVHWLAVVLGEVQTERTTFSHRGALVLLSAEEQLLVGCRFKQHARL